MLAMEKSLLALTLLTSLLLGACATEPLPGRFDETALVEGAISLECEGPRCAFVWQTKRKAMAELYDAGDWRSLALLVASVDVASDLAYFYLGRSAEALDAPEAAASYFDLALAAERKCEDFFFSGCAGIDVAGEAMEGRERIAALLAPPEMDLVDAQTRLSKLGLYTIKVDGVMGPHTRAAIELFQQRHGIPRSGELDAPTRIALSKIDAGHEVAEARKPSAAPAQVPAPDSFSPKSTQTPVEAVTVRQPAGEAVGNAAPRNGKASLERTRVTVEVDLLSDADPFADVVEVVEQGSWVDVIDWGDEWSRVSHGNKVGYVYTEILQ
jgi:hypothetical protein